MNDLDPDIAAAIAASDPTKPKRTQVTQALTMAPGDHLSTFNVQIGESGRAVGFVVPEEITPPERLLAIGWFASNAPSILAQRRAKRRSPLAGLVLPSGSGPI